MLIRGPGLIENNWDEQIRTKSHPGSDDDIISIYVGVGPYQLLFNDVLTLEYTKPTYLSIFLVIYRLN